MRSHYCGLVSLDDVGSTISLCGWVHGVRDHGGVLFVSLRDREGLIQVVFHPQDEKLFEEASTLRGECVVGILGTVIRREPETVNLHLATGSVEVHASQLTIFNFSLTPPFHFDDKVSDVVRLSHRVVDLRRPTMQNNLKTRYLVTRSFRSFFDQNGFMEIETPLLTRSTPEGARDYLVPSRVYPGQFFALPQSPQLFKQMLMVAGFDRYYQVTRCFRDEDLRADRQPEFTQVDVEMSFCSQDKIRELMESCVRQVFNSVDIELPSFPVISYQEAMAKYGSDKPDLRSPLVLTELTDISKNVDFKVFSSAANMNKGLVSALRVPARAALSRSEIDSYTGFVSQFGAKGLAWIRFNNVSSFLSSGSREGLQSPIVKNLSDSFIRILIDRSGVVDGDLVFFGADRSDIVCGAMGALRVQVSKDKGLMSDGWYPLWVIDFPLFDRDPNTGRLLSLHHPFTAPTRDEDLDTPDLCIAQAYDLVLNGTEIGGGSIRIHKPSTQEKVFSLLGLSSEEFDDKFGFFLNVLRNGAPPHGGIAFGLDRISALICGEDSIRDVIAFPKTQKSQCLLTGSPSTVKDDQLLELGLLLAKPKD
ncbi:aspartyl-tRNA synthetase [Candidatus Ichthyocystis hellenicum]|uniref:Aspartate--tRNA(Asp/Asn) ligase n=1 Tax=Candidatus Ichthyocystis hellenicum TaxID=1561003 RepID=A0A0S4M3A4_9BURK|nr:aspartate--tRNA ligase [Candidatus Ichthyocystis hellenicum]CUT17452.1 aspartyl-tRNA synthetase [Candidatus Ichthyocystis hellenicum]